MKDILGWLASIVAGGLLWAYAITSFNGREPWDRPEYWSIYFPTAILLAFLLGAAFPRRAWRWSIAVMLMQLPAMMLISGSDAGLLPLAVVLLVGLSVPGMVVGVVGGGLRRWLGDAQGT